MYIEVISSENLTAPYSIVNGADDPSFYTIIDSSRPIKRLNYEINERLLAPFNNNNNKQQSEQRAITMNSVVNNWLAGANHKQLQSTRKVPTQSSGMNRYSDESMYPIHNSGVQYRKKVIRKKKINRPTGMAASSSSSSSSSATTNLYGGSATHLLTGALMTKPLKQNSRPPIVLPPQPPIIIPKSFITEKKVPNRGLIEVNDWKPITNYASTIIPHNILTTIATPTTKNTTTLTTTITSTTTSTISPLIDYRQLNLPPDDIINSNNNKNNNQHSSLQRQQQISTTPVVVNSVPKITISSLLNDSLKVQVHNLNLPKRPSNFDFAEILRNSYTSLLNKSKYHTNNNNHNHEPIINRFESNVTNVNMPTLKGQTEKNLSSLPFVIVPSGGHSSTPKPTYRKVNVAQFNRYVVIPQKNHKHTIALMLNHKNVTRVTGENEQNRFLISNNTGNSNSKYTHDFARILSNDSSNLNEPYRNYNKTIAPIRDTLENFIKKTIGPKAEDMKTVSGYQTQARSFPTMPFKPFNNNFINYLSAEPINNNVRIVHSKRPTSLSQSNSGHRRTRKYRPLITLEQSTSAPPKLSPSFSSQRISPTTISPMQSSFNLADKSSINLEEPNSVVAYHSPNTNELNEIKLNDSHLYNYPYNHHTNYFLPKITNSGMSHKFANNDGLHSTTLIPPLPTVPITTTKLITDLVDNKTTSHILNNLIRTTSVVPTITEVPTISEPKFQSTKQQRFKKIELQNFFATNHASTGFTTTTTSTTSAPTLGVSSGTETYGYYEDYDNYGDYDDTDSHWMGNKTNVLSMSIKSSTTTTTTTTTTTEAPMMVSYKWRHTNVTR